MNGLLVDQVSVRYGSTVALNEVTLEIAPGELVAVIGESGSGKSSLLRAIAGLEPLAAGGIFWDGANQANVPVSKRRFAVMFQDGQLFPHLNVGANVGYALYRKSKAERARRVAELLDLVGLSGYQDRPITALSGGQAQRVALARSLAAQPRLLLLDEPLSALDAGLREHLAHVLAAGLRATGTPALYVTHDQDEAFTVADRVAVLVRGRLLQVATPSALWSQPANREVAAFLGYRPFLSPQQAQTLGWGDAPDRLIALGPDALVEDSGGVEVAVRGATAGRGETIFEVELFSDQRARVRVPGIVEQPKTIRVGLVPDGCALLATHTQ